ncbi:MAG: extensin family protein [Polyangiaceae bacterium]
MKICCDQRRLGSLARIERRWLLLAFGWVLLGCQAGGTSDAVPLRVASAHAAEPQPARFEAAMLQSPQEAQNDVPTTGLGSGARDPEPPRAAGAFDGLPTPNFVATSNEPLPNATYSLVTADTTSDSLRISGISPAQCRAELRKRKIQVGRAAKATPGVATPVRITGPLGKLRVVTPGPKSVYGVLDCRLLLVLAELEPVFVELSVDQIYVDNFYRPHARLPGRNAPSQHAFGLAIDIDGFRMTDGTVLRIEEDFHGVLGAPVCGADAEFSERSRKAILLRNIVCELSRRRVFNYLLTPNYDAAHRNHIHADIKRNCRDHVVR